MTVDGFLKHLQGQNELAPGTHRLAPGLTQSEWQSWRDSYSTLQLDGTSFPNHVLALGQDADATCYILVHHIPTWGRAYCSQEKCSLRSLAGSAINNDVTR